jgi:hypothetical protein
MVQRNSQTYNIEIKNVKEVYDYCLLNKILDIDEFINKCFKNGFHTEKYGLLGNSLNEGEKHLKTDGIEEKRVEIEVIREIRVEVPVEVIKEVEKIVTKIEYISDKTGESELLLKIQQLEENIFHLNNELDKEKQIFSTKTTEMENIFQNEMSKKDNELDELRHNLDISVDDGKLKMLQQTIQNLNSEIRDLKNKNKELEKKILEQPKNNSFINAKFHGSSNLNG